MHNQISSILLLTDDIPAKEFESFLLEKFPDKNIKVEVTPLKKQGRGANEIINLVFSDDMATNLMASFIFEFIMFGFGRLKKSFGAEPSVVVDLGDGIKVEIPEKIGEANIRIKVNDKVKGKKVYSIKFES